MPKIQFSPGFVCVFSHLFLCSWEWGRRRQILLAPETDSSGIGLSPQCFAQILKREEDKAWGRGRPSWGGPCEALGPCRGEGWVKILAVKL